MARGSGQVRGAGGRSLANELTTATALMLFSRFRRVLRHDRIEVRPSASGCRVVLSSTKKMMIERVFDALNSGSIIVMWEVEPDDVDPRF